MSKKELRREKLYILKDMCEDEIYQKSLIIQNYAFNNYLKNADNIFIYIAMEKEVQTEFLIEKLLKLNKNVFVPLLIDDRMLLVKINENTKYVKNKWGIKEPLINKKNNETVINNFKNSSFNFLNNLEINIAIIPLVAYDSNLNRLGRGKGFYDKFLSKNLNIDKIGIAFSNQFAENVFNEKHDIKLDNIINENGIL